MSAPLLEVNNLVRWYGKVRAVDGVSFTLAAGQVVGLIGANGAGKTTTMRILATLDSADSGTVRLGGVDIGDYPGEVRSRIGWMPDHFSPYQDVTVADYLDFFGRTWGLRGADLARRTAEIVEFTELGPLVDRLMDKLSKGQTQRLCLARTLLGDPDLLILDEPAAGLDPKARLEFKNLVRLLRDRGKTLLISSHILSELGEMCDTLVFMDGGRVVHHGDTESLQRHDSGDGGATFDITVHGPPSVLLAWLAMRPGWKLLEERRDGARAVCQHSDPAALANELKRLTVDGVPVIEFRRAAQRLEDAFVNILRDGRTGARPAAVRAPAPEITEPPPSLP
ncbi:MAG TPA: ABC transporter ATP-binding protein [Lacunisphaera sp.]|nr:ABC transporter ATP-binding protein [Lacunisphaera sp.]